MGSRFHRLTIVRHYDVIDPDDDDPQRSNASVPAFAVVNKSTLTFCTESPKSNVLVRTVRKNVSEVFGMFEECSYTSISDY